MNGDTQKAADFIMVRRQEDQVWVITAEAGSHNCLTALRKAPVTCGNILLAHSAARPDGPCAQGKYALIGWALATLHALGLVTHAEPHPDPFAGTSGK